jgi:hypothetical protein
MSNRPDRRHAAASIAVAAALILGCGAATLATAAPAHSRPAPRPAPPPGWKVDAREYIDLWFHGFAMLTSDTGRVPFFDRGYKQRMQDAKRAQHLLTALDANQSELSARFAANPALANAQFLAMYFPSFQEIVNATDQFNRSGGNPRSAADPQMRQELGLLASLFQAPADRNWLRLFVQSLQDENSKFYQAYWNAQQSARAAGYAAFSAQWQSAYYPKLQRFLNNTQQASGDLLLSVPLGGEGRTLNETNESNIIAVAYPATADAAPDALYAFVHEAVARLVDEAIADNTTPAEKRSGATAGYEGVGAVRGGALLLQRAAPELLQGYMRYYLSIAGAAAPTAGDATATFAAAFPMPQPIVDAIGKEIDVVLGGI